MASINYAAREINVKIVYYGPGLSGKTTNLQVIHRKVPPEFKSDMVSLATETDRTLFFDFLPLDLGKIKGFATKFQLYTVPGQVYYNATRKLVLRGVDGVVFVADSGQDKIDENLESFQNLEDNLAEYGYKRENIPIIVQYNKRDLPNALPVEDLNQYINKYNLPWSEAVANKGIGVFDSLKLIGKIVIDYLNKKYSRGPRSAAPATPPVQRMPPPIQRAVPRQSPSHNAPPVMYPQQMRPPMQPPMGMNRGGGGFNPQQMRPQQFAPQQQGPAGQFPGESEFVPPVQQSPRPPVRPQPQAPRRAPAPPAMETGYNEHVTFEPQQSQGMPGANASEAPLNQDDYYNYGSIDIEPMGRQQAPSSPSRQYDPGYDPSQAPQMQSSGGFDSSGKTDLDLEIERYQREIEEKQRRMRTSGGAGGNPSPQQPYVPSAPQQQRMTPPPVQPQVPQNQGAAQQDYDVYNMEIPPYSGGSPQQPAQPMIGNGEEEEMFFTSVDTDRHKKPVKRPVNPRTQQQKGFLSKFFNKDMP